FSSTFLALTFFFNPPATSEIYTLSLHDALPIYKVLQAAGRVIRTAGDVGSILLMDDRFLLRENQVLLPEEWDSYYEVNLHTYKTDRKSTRLNSSHVSISYAVFCLKKKKKQIQLQ